jgi:NADH-quinone oxidoreductase subunit J
MLLLTNNVVYCLFFLILTSVNIVLVFICLGREFIAFVFMIVYVGAICILFVFVIMMLNIQLTERTEKRASKKIYSITAICILLLLTFFLFNNNVEAFALNTNIEFMHDLLLFHSNELLHLCILLYNYYGDCFLISGLILLVAMLSAITISFDEYKNNINVFKKQDIFHQLSKDIGVAVRIFLIKKY